MYSIIYIVLLHCVITDVAIEDESTAFDKFDLPYLSSYYEQLSPSHILR